MTRISGIFNDYEHAEHAVDELRKLGISDKQIGVLTRHSTKQGEQSTAKAAERGAAVGAGAGALFGIAAAAIPAIGPFITAGVLTSWMGATAGAVVSGAAVGAGSGALASALQERADFPEKEAQKYADRIEHGGVLVVVSGNGELDQNEVRSRMESNEASVDMLKAD